MTDVPSPTESYIMARQAWWAGDLEYCLRVLAGAGADGTAKLTPKDEFDPAQMIRWRAAHLYSLALSAMEDQRAPDEAFIIQSEHLRGAFHQIAPREFEFRAFLRDMDWDEELFLRATVVAAAEQPAEPGTRGGTTLVPQDNEAGEVDLDDVQLSWVQIDDNMLLEVSVSEFALLRAQMIWTRRNPPEDLKPVQRAFRGVLDQLENARSREL